MGCTREEEKNDGKWLRKGEGESPFPSLSIHLREKAAKDRQTPPLFFAKWGKEGRGGVFPLSILRRQFLFAREGGHFRKEAPQPETSPSLLLHLSVVQHSPVNTPFFFVVVILQSGGGGGFYREREDANRDNKSVPPPPPLAPTPFSSAPSLSFHPFSFKARLRCREACYSGNDILVNRLECGRGLRFPRKRGTLFSHSAQGQEKVEEGRSKKRWPFSPPLLFSSLFRAVSFAPPREGQRKGKEASSFLFPAENARGEREEGKSNWRRLAWERDLEEWLLPGSRREREKE